MTSGGGIPVQGGGSGTGQGGAFLGRVATLHTALGHGSKHLTEPGLSVPIQNVLAALPHRCPGRRRSAPQPTEQQTGTAPGTEMHSMRAHQITSPRAWETRKNPEVKTYDFTNEKGNPGTMVFKIRIQAA